MNKKLALLTLHQVLEGREGPFHPDKQYLEIGVYDLREPILAPFERVGNALENRIIGQINLDQGQILAAKSFIDERDSRDLVKQIIEQYKGSGPSGMEGETSSGFSGHFRITATEIILKEYFEVN